MARRRKTVAAPGAEADRAAREKTVAAVLERKGDADAIENDSRRRWIEEHLAVEHVDRPALDDEHAWRAMSRGSLDALAPMGGSGPTHRELAFLGVDLLPLDVCSLELVRWLSAARARHEQGMCTPLQARRLEQMGVSLAESRRLSRHQAADRLAGYDEVAHKREQNAKHRARWLTLFGPLPRRPHPVERPAAHVVAMLEKIAPLATDLTPAELWSYCHVVAERDEKRLANPGDLAKLIDSGIEPTKARSMTALDAVIANLNELLPPSAA